MFLKCKDPYAGWCCGRWPLGNVWSQNRWLYSLLRPEKSQNVPPHASKPLSTSVKTYAASCAFTRHLFFLSELQLQLSRCGATSATRFKSAYYFHFDTDTHCLILLKVTGIQRTGPQRKCFYSCSFRYFHWFEGLCVCGSFPGDGVFSRSREREDKRR